MGQLAKICTTVCTTVIYDIKIQVNVLIQGATMNYDTPTFFLLNNLVLDILLSLGLDFQICLMARSLYVCET